MNLDFFKKKVLTEEQKKQKFYKKLKIKTTDSENTINNKIYDYIKKGKGIDKIYLTCDQQKDPLFMSVVYNLNHKISQNYKPVKELQENIVFMKNYLRNMVSSKLNLKTSVADVVYDVLKDCKIAISNLDFVESTIDMYPGANVLLSVEKILTTPESIAFIDFESYSSLNKILNNLPIEYFEKELKYNNGDTLRILDETHKHYSELARFLARTHGFRGMANIDYKHLIKDMSPVYCAIDKDGVAELYHYITIDLKQNFDDSSVIKNRKEILKQTFVKDKKIRKLLSDDFYETNHMVDFLYYEK